MACAVSVAAAASVVLAVSVDGTAPRGHPARRARHRLPMWCGPAFPVTGNRLFRPG
ncbi:hypothetical protein FRACA_1610011 [Frankia canadensis]|uniref:Uncharacterized protein n=1 Tax=Frankia canadensis TaxID=1836972 RepID=A0A2I2KMR1_9ACTN|nr:hypothetical protein FRACA_1610011 [Frankia canadensis]SOU54222.1 hypothetical protein FRACA_1610011 [Frankia canadensis]